MEGSKYTKKSILSNPYRRAIYHFVRTNLGAHFSLIKKEIFSDKKSAGSAGQLIWHLEMLLKFKYIKKMKMGNFTLFLPIDLDDELGLISFLLRDELNKKIFNLIAEKGQVKKTEIYKILNEPRELVYYRINNLIEYGILIPLEKEPDELTLTHKKKEIIKKILIYSQDEGNK